MVEFDAFINYSSHDKAVADAACATLEAAGIRCWIAPRDILPGTDWGASVMDALDNWRMMVFIFSAKANTSLQIRREVERVVSRGISVVPFRIEDTVPTKAMAYFMGSVHWLDALSPPLERHLGNLAESAKALLAIDAPRPDMREGATPAQKSQTDTSPAPTSAAGGAANRVARTIKYSAIITISVGLVLGILALMYNRIPDFAALMGLAAVGYWLIYRNLAADPAVAKISALASAAAWGYFLLWNSINPDPFLFVVDAINVVCLIYIFAKMPSAVRRQQ